MFNGRLYRAAFVPVVIALAITAFSLGGRSRALTSTLAPDAFEGSPAFAELESLAAPGLTGLADPEHPLAIELGCALLRTAPGRALASHVFFGRGSFPDVSPLSLSRPERARSSPAGA